MAEQEEWKEELLKAAEPLREVRAACEKVAAQIRKARKLIPDDVEIPEDLDDPLLSKPAKALTSMAEEAENFADLVLEGMADLRDFVDIYVTKSKKDTKKGDTKKKS